MRDSGDTLLRDTHFFTVHDPPGIFVFRRPRNRIHRSRARHSGDSTLSRTSRDPRSSETPGSPQTQSRANSSVTMPSTTTNVPTPTPSYSRDVDRLLDGMFDGAQHFEVTSPFPLAGSAQHTAPSLTMRQSFNPTKTCTSCKRKNLIASRDFDPDRKTCRACLRTQRRRHALKVRAELNRARARRTATDGDAPG